MIITDTVKAVKVLPVSYTHLITANEVNLCLSIQAFQECVHSVSYTHLMAVQRCWTSVRKANIGVGI